MNFKDKMQIQACRHYEVGVCFHSHYKRNGLYLY